MAFKSQETEERGRCLNTGYHKRVHAFRNFLVVLPPPPYTKFKLGKKTLETSVQRCSWDERRGRVCVNWKTPQKFKSTPRRLSMIVVCLHPSYYAQFLCQESVNRNQDSNKFSPGAPTAKRPKVGINHGKRRARRREGAGDKAPECAIAAGRWVGRQTRCLVSVLTKRGINSMKQANLY